MAAFYQARASGRLFNLLLKEDAGGWLISYDEPAAPFLVHWPALGEQFIRAQTPPEYEKYACDAASTPARKYRLEMISPLLADNTCITDKKTRKAKAQEIAEKYAVSIRRVLRVYYRYLATRVLTAEKRRSPVDKPDFDWAIRTFYYSSKRLSLRAAYESMLLAKYSDAKGGLKDHYPSWRSFERYYYARGYNRDPGRFIAREGKSAYERNRRPIWGTAKGWRTSIGSYQMDATQADIYLVSRSDRSTVIGRPYIYLAVDTASQIIAGVYIGFDAGLKSVISCLANAARDKKEFCAEYGIDIAEEQSVAIRAAEEKAVEWKQEKLAAGRKEAAISRLEETERSIIKSLVEDRKQVDTLIERVRRMKDDICAGKIDADAADAEIASVEESVEDTMVTEEVRRQTVKAFIKLLRQQDFTVEKPVLVEEGSESYVKFTAQRPSGNRAVCRFDNHGKVRYKFDQYEGMSCLKDIQTVQTELERVYSVKLSDERVLWENPNRITKDADQIPGGGTMARGK